MLPDAEFTDERIGRIVEGALSWLADSHDVFIDINVMWMNTSSEDFGCRVGRRDPIEIILDGTKHTITRQTIVDGVNRQLDWEGAAPEKLAQFDSPYCMDCLWGADDVAASILQWGLGIHD